MQKNNWTKITDGYYYNAVWYENWGVGKYTIEFIHFRYPSTYNEIRQNMAAKKDGHKVRAKRLRRLLPTCYDDQSISQSRGKDWKRFTKKRHQWQK